MKQALLFIFCIGFVRLWAQQLPTLGLVAYYRMDNNARDASGYGNNGEIKGQVSHATDRFGNPCGALRFDEATGYISVPTSASLESPVNAISIAAWFKRELAFDSVTGNWVTLVCKGNERRETSANPQYRFQVFLAERESTVSLNTDFTEYVQQFSSQPVQLDRWYFYTLVYSGTAVTLYLNGKEVSTFNYNMPLTVNKQPLEIGRDIPANTEYFSGCLDDIRIYNRALDGNEVAALYPDSTGSTFTRNLEWSLPENPVHETQKDSCYAKVNFSFPTVLMDCEPAKVIQLSGPASGTAFAPGETALRFAATGRSGSKQTYGFNITVKDRIPPVLTCPADITVYASPKASGIPVNYSPVKATDNCSVVKTRLTAGLPSGSFFPKGTSVVTWRAADASENVTDCSFKVTVEESGASGSPVSHPYVAEEPVHYNTGVIRADSCIITLLIFDSGIEDNDTVSVIFNNEVIVDYTMLRNRKANTLQNIIKKTIHLQSGKPNYLVLKAWNTGTTWPNTATIDIYSGEVNSEADMRKKTAIRKEIESQPGLAGGLLFSCE